MRGYSAIMLIRPKTPHNVGGVLRAAHCFGASLVIVVGARYKRLRHAPTDTFRAERHIPIIEASDPWEALPFDCAPVAVELGYTTTMPLPLYDHPARACYIFGPEDGTLPMSLMARCASVLYIPATACLNLAAAVNVTLYARTSAISFPPSLP